MLSLGFAEDMDTILSKVPEGIEKQTCLFSATVPEWVKKVASKYIKKDHVKVNLIGDDEVKASELIEHIAIQCAPDNKFDTLADIIKVYGGTGRVIAFADKKTDITKIVTHISNCKYSRIFYELSSIFLRF